MINISISDEAAPVLEKIRLTLGAKDHGKVITQALILLQAAINAHAQGMKVGFINDEGAVIEMFNPKPVLDLKAEPEKE